MKNTAMDPLANLPKSPEVRSEFGQAVSGLCRMLTERGEHLGHEHVRNLTVKFANHCAKRQWNVAAVTAELSALADAIGENIDGILNPRLTLKKMVDLHRAHNHQAAATLRRAMLSNPCDGTPPREVARHGRYRLVECLTQRHLQEETATLGHCVGGTQLDHYTQKMASGASRIFSLRTAKGRPVHTIEYDTRTKTVVQIEGEDGSPTDKKPGFRALCRCIHALSLDVPVRVIRGLPNVDGKILAKDGRYVSGEHPGSLPLADILCGRTYVDNATDPDFLRRMCECPRLTLDVTELDPALLPGQVKSGLFSNARHFHAPLLESCDALDIPLAETVCAPRLRATGTINARLAKKFAIPELKTAGDIDVYSLRRFRAPKLEVCGCLSLGNASHMSIPQMRIARGAIYAPWVMRFHAPHLKIAKDVLYLDVATSFAIPNLEISDNIFSTKTKHFSAPKLRTCKHINLKGAKTVNLPSLRNARHLLVEYARSLRIPRLETSNLIMSNGVARFNAPNLRTSDSIHADLATRFHAPLLETHEKIHAGCTVKTKNHIIAPNTNPRKAR